MKRETLSCLCGLALAGSLNQAVADTRANPYQPIVEVNAFRLLPKPVVLPVDNTPPPLPPATIKITGISSLSGAPKVLLEITDATTKKVERPSPMLAGEKQGTVEVVSIDADKGSVTIRNSGVETILTFERDGIKPTGATASPVAMLVPPNAVPVPTPFPAATITPGVPRNVVMVGGSTAHVTDGNPIGGGFIPNSSSSIPARPTRGVETSGDNNNYNPNAPRQLTREEQMILIERNRANPNRVGPPLPPTPLTPPKLPTAETPATSPPTIPTLPVPPRFNGRLQ